MSLVCKNCGAVYKGRISPYSKFVKCTYCDGVIVVPSAEGPAVIPSKDFGIEQFKAFLAKRGVSSFDPVSGILRFGNQEVIVHEDGTISGSKTLKPRVEKWLHKFMSQK